MDNSRVCKVLTDAQSVIDKYGWARGGEVDVGDHCTTYQVWSESDRPAYGFCLIGAVYHAEKNEDLRLEVLLELAKTIDPTFKLASHEQSPDVALARTYYLIYNENDRNAFGPRSKESGIAFCFETINKTKKRIGCP